jgi:hypothetical protein
MGCCLSSAVTLNNVPSASAPILPNNHPLYAEPIYAEAVPVYAGEPVTVPVVKQITTVPMEESNVTITIKHVRGVAQRDGEWCLNNIYVIDGSGTFMRHSLENLFHEWRKQGESFDIQCSDSARFVAFASQDMTSAHLSVRSSSNLVLPDSPVETVHWSNGDYAQRPWTAECNNNVQKWAYTVVPLHKYGTQESEISISSFSSWKNLNKLRSSGF